MPSVASDPSALLPPQHNPGARARAAESDAAEPSLFAAMVESADRPPPPERDSPMSRTSSTVASASDQQVRTPEQPSTEEAASSPAASEATESGGSETSRDASVVETVGDATELLDALASAVGTGPAATPMPSAAVVPISVETVLVAQGSFEAAGAIDTAAGTAPQVTLPELPEPGRQMLKDGMTAPAGAPTMEEPGASPHALLANAGEAAVSIETAVAPVSKPAAPTSSPMTATDGSTVDDRPPEAHTPIGPQPAPVGQTITAQAKATPVADGKRQPSAEPPPVAAGEQEADATTTAGDKPSDDAEPVLTERPAHQRQGPHGHADASKRDDLQTLGEQVSDAARNSKPASEAVHAVLLANERAVGAVAHTAAAQTTWEPAVPIAGLAIEIAARAQAGQSRFEIRLDPPELGRIDVRLDIDRSGQVTSRLVVERAETLDQLRRDAAGLERALQDAGLKTSQNGLEFSLRDQGFAGRGDSKASPDAARLVVPDPDLAPVETLVSGYGRLLRTGGIDIRV